MYFSLFRQLFLVGSGRFEMVAPVYLCRSTFAQFEQLAVASATNT